MENNSLEPKQYIVVKLGNEQFGIDIQYVDNIVRKQRITRVPKVQPYFKGVINLRGEIMPVMNLRLKFGMEEAEYTNATRLIIIKPDGHDAIGIIVDEVKEVVTLGEDQIDKIAYNGTNENYKYLTGVGIYKDTLVSILNIGNIILDKENL